MIQPPLTPEPKGNGKIASNIRDLRKIVKGVRLVGRGVSSGPLGTTIRVPESDGRGRGSSVRAYYA